MSGEFHAVAMASELPNNSSKLVIVNGQKLLVCNADGQFYCVDSVCTHRVTSLEGGRIRRCTVICPEHGMPFDLKTGAPKGQLTDRPLRVFETRVVDGQIEVKVD